MAKDNQIKLKFNVDLGDKGLKSGISSLTKSIGKLESSLKGFLQLFQVSGAQLSGFLTKAQAGLTNLSAATKGVDFKVMSKNFAKVADAITKDAKKAENAVKKVNDSTTKQRPRTPRATRGPPSKAKGGHSGHGSEGTGLDSFSEILPSRGPIVQLTGLLFLLQGAFFGVERAIERVISVTLGANIALEQHSVSLTAILGTYEKAQKVITDFALPFAARVPFFEFDAIVNTVERLAAEGIGIDKITGKLLDGINESTGSFEQQFSGSLVELLGSAAVAFGKDIDQSTDAFISALQGRFVKIRRFGIDQSLLSQFGFSGNRGDKRGLEGSLTRILNQRFGGLLKEQSKTFTGAVSNLKDIISNINRSVFTGTFNVVRDSLQDVVGSLEIFEPAFAAVLDRTEERMASLSPSARQLAENLIAISDALGVVTSSLITAIGFMTKFAVPLAAASAVPFITTLGRLAGFLSNNLTKSVLEFIGVYDRLTNKLQLPLKSVGDNIKKSIDAVIGKKTQIDTVRPFIRLSDGKKVTREVKKFSRLGGAVESLKKVRSELSLVTRGFSELFSKKLGVSSFRPFFKGYLLALKGWRSETDKGFTAATKIIEEFNGRPKTLISQWAKVLSTVSEKGRETSSIITRMAPAIDGLKEPLEKSRAVFDRLFFTIDKGTARLRSISGGISTLRSGIGKLAATISTTVTESVSKITGSRLTGAIVNRLTAPFIAIKSIAEEFASLTAIRPASLTKFAEGGASAAAAFRQSFKTSIGVVGGQVNPFGSLLLIFKLFTKSFIGLLDRFTFLAIKGFQTLFKGLAIVTKTGIAALAGILQASFGLITGILKILLVPAIIETVGALRDMSKGIDSIRSKALKDVFSVLQRIGNTIQDITIDFATAFGIQLGKAKGGAPALKGILFILDLMNSALKELSPLFKLLAQIVRVFANILGTALKGVSIILSGLPLASDAMIKFGIAVGKASDYLREIDGTLNTFAKTSRTAAVALVGIKDAGLDILELKKAIPVLDGLADKAKRLSRESLGTSEQSSRLGLPNDVNQLQSFTDKFGSEAEKKALGAARKLFPTLFHAKIGTETALKAAKSVAEVFSSEFVRQLKDGTTKSISFDELFIQDSRDAINQASAKIALIKREIAKDINDDSTFLDKPGTDFAASLIPLGKNILAQTRGTISLVSSLREKILGESQDKINRRSALKALGIDLDNLPKELRDIAALYADVIGNVSFDQTKSSKAVDDFVKPFTKAVAGATELGDSFAKQIVDARNEVFSAQAGGSNDQLIEDTNRRIDALSGQEVAARLEGIVRLAELRDEIDKRVLESKVSLAKLQGDRSKALSSSIAGLQSDVKDSVGGVDITAELEKSIKSSTPFAPSLFNDLARKVRAGFKAEGGTSDEANRFLLTLQKSIRKASQTYNDYSATIDTAEKSTKNLTESQKDAQKTLSTEQSLVQKSVSNAIDLINKQLGLGEISKETAFVRLAAQNKLIQGEAVLRSNVELATKGLKAQTQAALKLEVSTRKLEAIGSLTEIDKLKQATLQLSLIEELFKTFTAEQQVQSGLISKQIAGNKQLFSSVNDIVTAQIAQRAVIADTVQQIQLLGLAQRGVARNQQNAIELQAAAATGSTAYNATLRKRQSALNEVAKTQDTLSRLAITSARRQASIDANDDAINKLKKFNKATGESRANSIKLAELQKKQLLEVGKAATDAQSAELQLSKTRIDSSNKLIDLRKQEFDLLKKQQDLQKKLAADRVSSVNSLIAFQEKALTLLTGGLNKGQKSVFANKKIDSLIRLQESLKGVDENKRVSAATRLVNEVTKANAEGLLTNQRFEQLKTVVSEINKSFKDVDFQADNRSEIQRVRDELFRVKGEMSEIASTLTNISTGLGNVTNEVAGYTAKLTELLAAFSASQKTLLLTDPATVFSKLRESASEGAGLVDDVTSNKTTDITKVAFSTKKDPVEAINNALVFRYSAFEKTVSKITKKAAGLSDSLDAIGNRAADVSRSLLSTATKIAEGGTATATALAESASDIVKSSSSTTAAISDFALNLANKASGGILSNLDGAEQQIAAAKIATETTTRTGNAPQQDSFSLKNSADLLGQTLNDSIEQLAFKLISSANDRSQVPTDVNLTLDPTGLSQLAGTIEGSLIEGLLQAIKLEVATGDITNA